MVKFFLSLPSLASRVSRKDPQKILLSVCKTLSFNTIQEMPILNFSYFRKIKIKIKHAIVMIIRHEQRHSNRLKQDFYETRMK